MKISIVRIMYTGIVAVALLGIQACALLPDNVQSTTASSTPINVYEFQDSLAADQSGPAMVLVEKGNFVMGDHQDVGRRDEYPLHEVSIDYFAIGKYEVTIAEFRDFVTQTGYQTDAEHGNGCHVYSPQLKHWEWVDGKNWQDPNFSQQDNHPVVCVSWNDAIAYTKWLSDKTGHTYRLPTEAEWEYAARAGSTSNYHWGNEGSCEQANCCNTGTTWLEKQTVAVGGYGENPFGLHDTHGNVWEWTASPYAAKYNGAETQLADSANTSKRRAVRGGSWHNLVYYTRTSRRMPYWPQERFSTTGFRLARDVTKEFVQTARQKINNNNSMLSHVQSQ